MSYLCCSSMQLVHGALADPELLVPDALCLGPVLHLLVLLKHLALHPPVGVALSVFLVSRHLWFHCLLNRSLCLLGRINYLRCRLLAIFLASLCFALLVNFSRLCGRLCF